MEIFAAADADTGDSLAFELDGDRLTVHTMVEGRRRTCILIEPRAGLRLARAILEALDREPTPKKRATRRTTK